MTLSAPSSTQPAWESFAAACLGCIEYEATLPELGRDVPVLASLCWKEHGHCTLSRPSWGISEHRNQSLLHPTNPSTNHQSQRLSNILSHTLSLSPAVDIIFLQELSHEAFQFRLKSQRFAGSLTTITLLSKARFHQRPNPGPVWRVKHLTRFGRDALCCDVFAANNSASISPDAPGTRLRLVNVHLESLPIQPSLQPQQVAAAAALLRSAGRGVVAGDFNPVLPADETLVRGNGLVDAWAELRPGEPGYTWGADGKEPFPPNRMDKAAAVGLQWQDVEVLSPGYISCWADPVGEGNGDDQDQVVPWSDHSGLKCSFKLAGL
ncbi:hypothetical protein N658DRAFT_483938 [Parathielavia hyrcaniae]|uniref:Endonuclease/exonuclease/phosphatase domain-containing protein n=1 Tax=Parathielavia hyrcaniae TaxID=113614 RepID=A0AAN6Q7W1_9PEZI|nr:hypothetical protein N658DRAFT_483938 [Parathielavia hyrcaniae]